MERKKRKKEGGLGSGVTFANGLSATFILFSVHVVLTEKCNTIRILIFVLILQTNMDLDDTFC